MTRSVRMQVAMDMRKMAGWKEAKKGDTKADVWLVDGRKKGAIPYAVCIMPERPAARELLQRLKRADAQEQHGSHAPLIHPRKASR